MAVGTTVKILTILLFVVYTHVLMRLPNSQERWSKSRTNFEISPVPFYLTATEASLCGWLTRISTA